jgi:hypothetical protein
VGTEPHAATAATATVIGGARGDRDDGRRFSGGSNQRFRNRDNRDSWSGFGSANDCEWLRRRAAVSDSSYWSSRYRTACAAELKGDAAGPR